MVTLPFRWQRWIAITSFVFLIVIAYWLGRPKELSAADPDKKAPATANAAAIYKAQAAVAEKAYRGEYEGLSRTRRFGNVLVPINQNPETVYLWSVRWLEAERQLAANREARAAACKAHLQRMTALKKAVEALATDLMPRMRIDEAEWYRLQAELSLAEAQR